MTQSSAAYKSVQKGNYISQTPLQLHVVMRLVIGQWVMNRSDVSDLWVAPFCPFGSGWNVGVEVHHPDHNEGSTWGQQSSMMGGAWAPDTLRDRAATLSWDFYTREKLPSILSHCFGGVFATTTKPISSYRLSFLSINQIIPLPLSPPTTLPEHRAPLHSTSRL